DPETGEEFLIASATQIDANQFSRVVDQWAVMADPEAADRGWREASSKEEVFLSPTMDGYLLSGWLSTVNGAIVEEALNSHMGRKSATICVLPSSAGPPLSSPLLGCRWIRGRSCPRPGSGPTSP